MIDKTVLLNDEQMRDFIANGSIVVKTDLPPDFHEAVYRKIDMVFEKEGNPGNNLLPRIPEIQAIFNDPVVSGALAGVVGPSYYMHPHRHPHYNRSGSDGQRMHIDSWARRRHRTRWVMALYYPQDTPEEMGPTRLIPGSHYYNSLPDDNDSKKVLFCGQAGTIAIIHYDLWHQATPNRSDKNRYMLKFLFTRMEEPQYPSWNSKQAEWQCDGDDAHKGMWAHLWNWHYGVQNRSFAGSNLPEAEAIPELIEGLQDDSESVGLDAAYALAAIGTPAVPALIEALQGWPSTDYRQTQYGAEAICHNASYALSAIGTPAVPTLIEASEDPNWKVRAIVAATLGDIGPTAREAIPALIKALKDESEHVRRHAADGLGLVAQSSSIAVPALAQALDDADVWVCRNASLALARIGLHAEQAVPALIKALNNENRYVRANAAHALQRIGTPEAHEALLNFLLMARWCSSTSRESTH